VDRFSAHFRDSHVDGDDVETIVHDYTVVGSLDTSTRTITSIDATVQVLPWQECPGAIGSAPDWPTGGWKVTVEGRPSMVLDSKIATHGEDETDQGCLGTAMHAVHAIAPVCAVLAGIDFYMASTVIYLASVRSRNSYINAARNAVCALSAAPACPPSMFS
jgi:hypothetical protein